MICTSITELTQVVHDWKSDGKSIVWTNGCFDILHPGHITTFEESKKLGDVLIVGLNGDLSPYRESKPGRPIHPQMFRSLMLDAIKYVDYVYIFNEETPLSIIKHIKPDVLVKGGDYNPQTVVGYDDVTGYGGEVVIIPTVGNYATTNTVKAILQTYA